MGDIENAARVPGGIWTSARKHAAKAHHLNILVVLGGIASNGFGKGMLHYCSLTRTGDVSNLAGPRLDSGKRECRANMRTTCTIKSDAAVFEESLGF